MSRLSRVQDSTNENDFQFHPMGGRGAVGKLDMADFSVAGQWMPPRISGLVVLSEAGLGDGRSAEVHCASKIGTYARTAAALPNGVKWP
jgi:hypothetical protein